ncbi:hypothetical protein ACYHMX_30815 (plasmid) [Pseudomonas amygdali pv. morsprunorum]|uniref:TraO protein n=3 Tax=Pseudomonas syringae group TaxID=136849 RepID=A0A3M4AHA5_9PSED|nr:MULTISPECIES: hypothetical protein [Pseudomonas syringae group]KPW67657.1 hypothetical protein ALO78_200191 [Pseudomonas amygdali pv. ciccaronei]KPW72656.1 hypothetical protein ALO76_200028 [Pseudomonas syringae pv. coriandricola]KUG44361.1 hypothetical protein ALP79_200070 [Pseudomonas savastanoi pv. fraxini]RMP05616.1 hypothetical protein ALQ30_200591 [Pseudomonas syringae pv. persicae]RMT85012.1 hypothetical protein ALP41_200019 [Pseudomonas savastanoi pv. nerii]
MNFKTLHSGEGYSTPTRRNLMLNALVLYERMYEVQRMLPQPLFERFTMTDREFCEAIQQIARLLDTSNTELMSERVTLTEINEILRGSLYQVLTLPPHEGLKNEYLQ